MPQKIINIAVIAHVDHGKTTLVDAFLKQGGAFQSHEAVGELIMDSNEQERERGITIFSKNCAIKWNDLKINIVDTPGHADFSSEVERVLKVVDTVLLLVDAVEGPMPQTRFVLEKSLKLGLRPILVVNKIDKEAADPDRVINEVFDLFSELGATNEQLDFPIVYTIARQGVAKKKLDEISNNLNALFETVEAHTRNIKYDDSQPLQILIYSLEYDDYLGRIGVGKIFRGQVETGKEVILIRRDGSQEKAKINKLFIYQGLKKQEVIQASAGEIVAIAGFNDVMIGETFADPINPVALPLIEIGEPTVSMIFSVNNSPLSGRDGKLVTTRQIRERLYRELETNVGLRVEAIENSDSYQVSGRGELHLAVLLENMRREGYEIAVSRPTVISKIEVGTKLEPMEILVITVPDVYAGVVINKIGMRRGEMKHMISNHGYTRLEFEIPTRGLIGYLSEFLRDTRGEGTMDHIFLRYDPWKGEIAGRSNGVLISQVDGKAVAYALYNLQDRGNLFIAPGTEIYEGMIIGEHCKPGDLVTNPLKEKKLTNIRAAASDEAIRLEPERKMTLELAIEFIDDDELVEITPNHIRLRKKLLKEYERKRSRE